MATKIPSKILEIFYDLSPRKQIHLHDNGNLNMKSGSCVKQQTLKHQALACTEINFTISHNWNKILDYDWLPEHSTFNQLDKESSNELSNNKRVTQCSSKLKNPSDKS